MKTTKNLKLQRAGFVLFFMVMLLGSAVSIILWLTRTTVAGGG